MPSSEPLVVITNAAAGTADERALEAALAVLRAHTSVEVCPTSNPGELDGVLHRAGSRRIVVAGGDGSLHAVVAALHRRRELEGRALGLLPLGTGNDFARTLDVPLEPEAAAEVIVTGRPQSMDLVVDEVGAIVVNSVHLGAGADAGRLAAGFKRRLGAVGVGRLNLGKLGYPMGAAVAAINPPTLRLRVEVDGEVVTDVDEPVLMVVLGNGASVGGGTEIAPDADPADGQIDVLIASPVGVASKLAYAALLPFGRHTEHESVRTLRGATVSVSGSEFWCNADGEIYGPERHRTWRVEASAYAMIVPEAG